MAFSKVIFNGDTLMDVTGDNPATDNMLTGTRATGANGQTVNGAVVTAPASTADPEMDGTADPGTESTYSRGDHVHPTDTTRQAKITASGILKGNGSGGVSAAVAGTDYISSHQDISGKLDKSGGTMTGALTLSGAPTSNLHAATKKYVDDNIPDVSGKLDKSGGTMTGALTLSGAPTSNLHAATKKYVDDSVPSVPSASTTAPSMDGNASYGSGTTWARADHVHPTDTSRAAASDLTSHTGNTSNPHSVTAAQVGAVPTSRKINGNALTSDVSLTASDVGAASANDLSSHTGNTSNPHSVTASQVGAAPTSHAASATTYGAGTGSNYGHVKLSDATDSTSSNSGGTAATPAAVKAAYDLAASKTSNTGTITAVQANGTSVATSGTANIPAASTSAYGVTKLSSSTSSTSTALAATASAVKAVNDRITYGSTDLTAGTSALTTGVLYAYYT